MPFMTSLSSLNIARDVEARLIILPMSVVGHPRLTMLSGTESVVAEHDNMLETEMLDESTPDGEDRVVEWVGF